MVQDPSKCVLLYYNIGSVLLSLPGVAAPSTKKRGANNCETFLFLEEMYHLFSKVFSSSVS